MYQIHICIYLARLLGACVERHGKGESVVKAVSHKLILYIRFQGSTGHTVQRDSHLEPLENSLKLALRVAILSPQPVNFGGFFRGREIILWGRGRISLTLLV